MPPRTQAYTLRGFSQELDWRPLHFVDPVPAARICDACGLLPNAVGYLPCGHVLCKPCYQQCEHGCPIDGDECPGDGVLWISFPAASITRKKVKCWNAANGCSVITAASDISRHFHDDCKHHFINCLKCLVPVPRSSVCAHLMQGCVQLSSSASTDNDGKSPDSSSQSVDTAECSSPGQNSSSIASMWSELRAIKKVATDAWNEIMSLKAASDKQRDEIRSALKQLSSSQNSQLHEFTQKIMAATHGRDTKLYQIVGQMERGLKVATELKGESENCAAKLTALEARLLNETSTMRASLEILSFQSSSQAGKLGELSRSVQVLNEVLKGKTEKGGPNQNSCAARPLAANASARYDAVLAKLNSVAWHYNGSAAR